MFSNPLNTDANIQAIIKLSAAKASYLVLSKILMFGNELKYYYKQ